MPYTLRWPPIVATAFFVALVQSCSSSSVTPPGSGGSGGDPPDASTDAAEPETSTDAATDASMLPQPVFVDQVYMLMWQKNQKISTEVWVDAKKYCDNLNWGGYTDWRLPTIDELRFIIMGCAASETGGACGVGAACLMETCGGATCDGCPGSQGPAQGCYRIADLEGDCTLTWSSSVDPGSPLGAWYVNFSNARIRYDDQALYHAIRCVRNAN